MDLLGYAALGGLERLTIVAGAVIIGYWGYRLYTAEKNAGLIFMGLAVLVLVGALATGGSYLKSVGEGYQLASLPAETAAADSPFADAAEPAGAPADSTVAEPTPAAVPDAELAAGQPTPAAAPPAAQPAAAAVEPPAAAAPTEPSAAGAAAVEPVASEAEESPVRLATGAELGGRIVSVKSENVSLEWTSAAPGTDAPGTGTKDSGSE